MENKERVLAYTKAKVITDKDILEEVSGGGFSWPSGRSTGGASGWSFNWDANLDFAVDGSGI